MNWLALPLGSRAPEVVNAIIEVPGGQANKYEYDKTLQVVRLDRPLYASVHYPGDYGFVPSTLAGDDDPPDILVLLPNPTFVGCLIEARPVGVLEMLDQEVPDQKVLGVAVSSPTHKRIRHHSDLEPHVRREIRHFFSVYKELGGSTRKYLVGAILSMRRNSFATAISGFGNNRWRQTPDLIIANARKERTGCESDRVFVRVSVLCGA